LSAPADVEADVAPLDAAAPATVSVQHVSKAFRLLHQRYSTLKERALHPFHRRTFEALPALDDVTVDVAKGEFFGIVGRCTCRGGPRDPRLTRGGERRVPSGQ
jgi:hypothetical protein